MRRGDFVPQAQASATRDSLKSQSEDLGRRVASAGGADADSLKRQLADTQSRLKLLESEGKIAETIIHNYASVCLLRVVVEFLDKQSGLPIRVAVDAAGEPLVDDKDMAQLDVTGQDLISRWTSSVLASS